MSIDPLKRIPNPLPPIRNAAGDVLRGAQDLAGRAGDLIADGIEAGGELIDIARSGDWYARLVDPVLDGSALGPDTAHVDEPTGSLGQLITNRLSIGEAVSLRPDVNAMLGGIALGAGAQIQIKRTGKPDPRTGKPAAGPIDAQGQPPSELEVRLTVAGNVGLGLDLSMQLIKGKDFGMGGDESTLGGRLGGRVRAEAGLQGEATFVFTFDPKDSGDVEDLTGLFKATASSSLEAALPGAKRFLFGDRLKDFRDDLSAFGRHMSAMEGEVGLYAIGDVEGTFGVGTYDRPKPGEKPKTPEPEAPRSLKGTVVDLLTDAVRFNLASFRAALGGEANVGARRDFRRQETTLYLEAEGKALLKAGIVGISRGEREDMRYVLEATMDAKGELNRLAISQVMSKEDFSGLGSTDLLDRMDGSLLARLGKDTRFIFTHELPASELEAFKRQWAEDPAKASRDMLRQVLSTEPSMREPVTVRAESTRQIQLGVGIAGNEISLRVQHTQDHRLLDD